LSRFLQNNNAKSAPIPRSSSGQALKVKPMLDGRAIARKMKIIENYNTEADGNRK